MTATRPNGSTAALDLGTAAQVFQRQNRSTWLIGDSSTEIYLTFSHN